MQAFANTGVDPVWYAQRTRAENEAFPWDHIDAGVSKAFLLREYRRSQQAQTTPDCRGGSCNACGWEKKGCAWSGVSR